MPEDARFIIPFDKSTPVYAIRVASTYPPENALAALRLPPYHGVVVVHGGAGKMEEDLVEAVQKCLEQSLIPFAEEQRLLIIDGGTDIGVSRIMGCARDAVRGTFPLLGIAPQRFAIYPGGPLPGPERVPLNTSHTHFVLVDGDSFGAESNLMVGLLDAVSVPGITLVVNGGEIVLQEVRAHAARGHTLVTIDGSGRIADALADPTSPTRASLPPHTRIEVASITDPAALTALLRRRLMPGRTGHSVF